MPAIKAPMTAAEVAKLGVGNHRVGGVIGLVLQVNKSGEGRSYTLRYTDPTGRRREVGIGSAHVITLAQARDKGLEIHQRLRLEGTDPIAAKVDAKEAAIEQALRREEHQHKVRRLKARLQHVRQIEARLLAALRDEATKGRGASK